MAEKRRLPIVQNNPPAAPSSSPGQGDGGVEQPSWHWVPIGAMVTIAVGVVLAKSFYMPFVQRQIERVYGAVHTPEEYARVNEHLAASVKDALQLRLMLGALPVAIVSMLVGGFVVGRFGPRTNARHGTLAGLCATILLVLVAGRSVSAAGAVAYALLVPIGGAMGWLGARVGVYLRDRP